MKISCIQHSWGSGQDFVHQKHPTEKGKYYKKTFQVKKLNYSRICPNQQDKNKYIQREYVILQRRIYLYR